MKNNVKEWWPEKKSQAEKALITKYFNQGFNVCLSIFNQARKDGKLWVAVDREELAKFLSDLVHGIDFDRITGITRELWLKDADALIKYLTEGK